jgi:hypothetical protein
MNRPVSEIIASKLPESPTPFLLIAFSCADSRSAFLRAAFTAIESPPSFQATTMSIHVHAHNNMASEGLSTRQSQWLGKYLVATTTCLCGGQKF